jgi:hypothetical protein
MTNLQEVSQKDLLISLIDLHQETELIRDIQEKLGKIGFINPTTVTPGCLDLETSEALAMFLAVAHQSPINAIGRSFAQKLLDVTTTNDWPINPHQDDPLGLTQVTLCQGRNRKLENRDIEETLPNQELQAIDPSKIGNGASTTLKLTDAIIADRAKIAFSSNNRIYKNSPEPQYPDFSSSEFLAWARH